MPASTSFTLTKSPTVVVNDATLAGLPWTNPANAEVADGACADVVSADSAVDALGNAYDAGGGSLAWAILGSYFPSGTYADDGQVFAGTYVNQTADNLLSDYLIMQSFGFAIPADAAVTGIQFQVSVKDPGSFNVTDYIVALCKSGAWVGANKSVGGALSRPNLGWRSYGGPGDLWATTWTPAEVNTLLGAAYMVLVSGLDSTAGAYVDTAKMTVWWARSTQYLKATNLGFALPPDAVITGIRVDVSRIDLQNSGSAVDRSVRLCKAGVPVGSDQASGTLWPFSIVTATYGGPGDLWGTTWTPADINNAGFGLAVAAACIQGPRVVCPRYAIDSVPITVYYTQASRVSHASNVM